jgi:hypothetical protein
MLSAQNMTYCTGSRDNLTNGHGQGIDTVQWIHGVTTTALRHALL